MRDLNWSDGAAIVCFLFALVALLVSWGYWNEETRHRRAIRRWRTQRRRAS